MTEIHCSICGLWLGEAAGEIEITCPLCCELRTYVKMAVAQTLPQQPQWTNDVHRVADQTEGIIKSILTRRSLDIY